VKILSLLVDGDILDAGETFVHNQGGSSGLEKGTSVDKKKISEKTTLMKI